MKLSAPRVLVWVQYREGTVLKSTYTDVYLPPELPVGELPEYVSKRARELSSVACNSPLISWEIISIFDGPRNLLRTEISAPRVVPGGHIGDASPVSD